MSGTPAAFPISDPVSAIACMQADMELIDALTLPGGAERLGRVFFWRSPAVSLGRSAPPSEALVARLSAGGLEAVTRPTGGAALLHGPGLDVSFSAALRRPRGHGPLDLVETGRELARPVLAGVRALGFDATFRDCAACGPAGENARQPLCFLQKTPFDILVGGHKVAAFALRRTGEVVFLHGSILVGEVPPRMIHAMVDAGIGTTAEWGRAQAAIGHLGTDPSRLAEGIAASV